MAILLKTITLFIFSLFTLVLNQQAFSQITITSADILGMAGTTQNN